MDLHPGVEHMGQSKHQVVVKSLVGPRPVGVRTSAQRPGAGSAGSAGRRTRNICSLPLLAGSEYVQRSSWHLVPPPWKCAPQNSTSRGFLMH
jgi:hypothetical protein